MQTPTNRRFALKIVQNDTVILDLGVTSREEIASTLDLLDDGCRLVATKEANIPTGKGKRIWQPSHTVQIGQIEGRLFFMYDGKPGDRSLGICPETGWFIGSTEQGVPVTVSQAGRLAAFMAGMRFGFSKVRFCGTAQVVAGNYIR